MRALRAIYREPDEVSEVLLDLFGVPVDLFLQAEAMGWLEWAARSDYDPLSFPGTLLWGHTVRHERQQLVVDHGWKQDDAGNFSSVISADNKTAIAVETGDRFTGMVVPGKSPRTNSRKGSRTKQMLSDNRAILQSDLFQGFGQATEPVNKDAPLLWIHLIHQSRGDVYGEISLPVVANGHDRIVGWKSRIILPKWRGGDGNVGPRKNPLQAAPDTEVRIVRRAS